jgi:ABC-type glycerol-3-phosphate transport system substrate-binding protein
MKVRQSNNSTLSKPNFRALLGASLVLLFIVSVSACQGFTLPGFLSSSTPPPATMVTLPTSTAIGAAPAHPVEATSESSKDLIIWVPPQFDPSNDAPASRKLKSHLQVFIDENPGVRITTRVKAVSGPAGLLASLNSASNAASQAVPALVLLTRSDLEAAADKGLILPVDTLTNTMDGKDWYDYARQLSTINGRTYGMPFCGDALILVYRPTRVAGPPPNWESVARQGQPVIFPAGERSALATINLYYSAGGSLRNELNQPAIQTRELEKVLKLYFDGLLQNTFPTWLAQYQNDTQALQAYREFKGQWLITWASNYLAELPADSTASTIPTLGDKEVTITSAWLWGLSDPQPDRRELSARLLEHMVEAEFLSQWGPLSASVPVRPSTLNKWTSPTIQALFNDILATAVIIPASDSLNLIGPILQEATGLILKRESDPIRASQGALDRLSAPSTTP